MSKRKNKKPPVAAIGQLRDLVDDIDEEILGLLNKRAQAALQIGEIKDQAKLKFHSPEREHAIYARLDELNKRHKGIFPNDALHCVFREIISASLSLEKPLRVAYLGPKATFTHLACIEHFGLSAQNIALRSIKEIFSEVQLGRVDYGVVPIENSTEGMVNHTLDLFVDSQLKIIAEEALEVEHNLLAKGNIPLTSIQTVVSHNQALAQCRNWLEENLSGIAIIEAESTAQAAQMAADDERVAAIASRFAAELYGLSVMAERIQDQVDNFTRFLILGREETARTGNDKTSLLFSVRDQPGALYKMLKPFAESGVNLTKIESRPRKTKPWEYVFFIDLDGHMQERKVARAVSELEKHCIFFKVLGSYPKVQRRKERETTAQKKRRKKS